MLKISEDAKVSRIEARKALAIDFVSSEASGSFGVLLDLSVLFWKSAPVLDNAMHIAVALNSAPNCTHLTHPGPNSFSSCGKPV